MKFFRLCLDLSPLFSTGVCPSFFSLSSMAIEKKRHKENQSSVVSVSLSFWDMSTWGASRWREVASYSSSSSRFFSWGRHRISFPRLQPSSLSLAKERRRALLLSLLSLSFSLDFSPVSFRLRQESIHPPLCFSLLSFFFLISFISSLQSLLFAFLLLLYLQSLTT